VDGKPGWLGARDLRATDGYMAGLDPGAVATLDEILDAYRHPPFVPAGIVRTCPGGHEEATVEWYRGRERVASESFTDPRCHVRSHRTGLQLVDFVQRIVGHEIPPVPPPPSLASRVRARVALAGWQIADGIGLVGFGEELLHASGVWDLLYGDGISQLIAPFRILMFLAAVLVALLPVVVGLVRGRVVQGLVATLVTLLAALLCLPNGLSTAAIVAQLLSGLSSLWILVAERPSQPGAHPLGKSVRLTHPRSSSGSHLADAWRVVIDPRGFFASLAALPDKRRAMRFAAGVAFVMMVVPQVLVALTKGSDPGAFATPLVLVALFVLAVRVWAKILYLLAKLLGGTPTDASSVQVAAYATAPLLLVTPLPLIAFDAPAVVDRIVISLAYGLEAYVTAVGMVVLLGVPRPGAWGIFAYRIVGLFGRMTGR